ncbi:hypothetical protein evm_008695 [Chilo suppressalis]|nr:hypothetical protein evm_008695 [Chilo suppressalis]
MKRIFNALLDRICNHVSRGRKISTSYIIDLLYLIFGVSEIIRDIVNSENSNPFNLLITLTVYLNIITLIHACQKLHNAWDSLNNSLTRLWIVVLKRHEDYEMHQLVRDLVRLVSQEPVRVYLMSSVPISMPLVPVTLSITITHIIVLLQFYHILN